MITTRDILAELISMDTTSRNPNRALMDYLSALLSEHGIESTLIPNEDGSKANLYCTVGPQDRPGVMLSGHTDVVPVDGQTWSRPAFELTESDGRLFGRGTADMKGFVASAVKATLQASRQTLTTPLHLALSYDEEIGCVGVRSLLDMLGKAPIKPAMCIVGEPTSLEVATRHKGKTAVFVRCIGREGHSALAPHALNAIHLACELVSVIRDKQQMIVDACQEPDLSDVPYTTLHVGRIHAGQALNIVPNLCTVDFEIRNAAGDDPTSLLTEIERSARQIVERARQHAPQADIEFDVWNSYPGLSTPVNSPVVKFVQSLVGSTDTTYVAFGTEGGLFSSSVGIPTVVCGPGSMAQGHKPDEYIETDQLLRCDQMLEQLVQFCTGSDALPQTTQ